MGTDEDVDFAVFQAFEDELLLLWGAEAGDHFDVDGELAEALFECFVVLEGEDGGGCEDGHLFSVLDGLEGGAHGHFRFAVADIAAEEAVHGAGRLHVALDVSDGVELIVGFGVVEGLFKLHLKLVVNVESGSLGGLTLGVELKEFVGHVGHGFLDASLGLGPLLGAEFVEHGRGASVGGAVFLDEVEAREGHVETGLIGELEDHELDGDAVLLNLFEADVTADAVLDMDDVVADGEVAEVGYEGGGFGFARLDASGDVGLVVEVVGAEEDEVCLGDTDAGGELGANDDGDADVAGKVAAFVVEIFAAGVQGAAAEAVGQLVFAKDSGESLDLGLIGSGEEDALIL